MQQQEGPLASLVAVLARAATREQAIAMAQRLLDDVAEDVAWLHGERISAEVEEAVG
jgi:hypothetical protein